MRSFFLLVFICGLTTVEWSFGAESSKPNVLFIAVDDLRPQIQNYQIDQYNTDLMVTPNMDILKERSMQFNRAFSNIPVCGASRLSLMTGARPYKIKGEAYGRFWSYHDRLDEASPVVPAGVNRPKTKGGNPAPTLPAHFKNNGYVTQSIGKVYHHKADDKESWTEGVSNIKGFKVYNIEKEENAWEIGVNMPDTAYPDGKHRDAAISALRTLVNKKQPFFLAVGFVKPHLPFNCPKKYWDMYDRDKLKLAGNPFAPKNAPKASLMTWGELKAYKNVKYKSNELNAVTDEYARSLIHGYYACVSYIDAMIGDVLRELDALKIRDNTIVILWGDHGWQLGEHGMWCKHCLYQTSLRVPLYIDAPGKPNNLRCDALVEYVDVYPTLSQLAGLPLPDHLQGTSMVPLLNNPYRAWKGAAFSNWQRGKQVRTDRYSYAEFYSVNDKLQSRMLYDLKLDPNENENISELDAYQELTGTLSKLLNEGWTRAAKGDANAPVSFDVLPDGTINNKTAVDERAVIPANNVTLQINGIPLKRVQNFQAPRGQPIWFEARGIFPQKALAFDLVEANGKRSRNALKRSGKGLWYGWLNPAPGRYFYQFKYIGANGEPFSRTGLLVVI